MNKKSCLHYDADVLNVYHHYLLEYVSHNNFKEGTTNK
jgi:hypothetical protein